MALGTSSPITTVKKLNGTTKSAIPKISAVVPETPKCLLRYGSIDFFTSTPPTAADNVPIKVITICITAKVLSGCVLSLINFLAAILPLDAMSRKNGTLVEANAISIQENKLLIRSNIVTIIHSIGLSIVYNIYV